MKSIGSFLAIVGILAIVMDFFGRVPKALFWIYEWGDTVAWIIKIALVVIGGFLYFKGKKTAINNEQNNDYQENKK